MIKRQKNSLHRFELLPPPIIIINRHHPKALCYREPADKIEIQSLLYSRELVYQLFKAVTLGTGTGSYVEDRYRQLR